MYIQKHEQNDSTHCKDMRRMSEKQTTQFQSDWQYYGTQANETTRKYIGGLDGPLTNR